MSLVNAFGNLALDSTLSNINTTLQTNTISVSPNNILTKFREPFESYTPNTTWIETKANGDLIQLDGNAVGCSYLVISKDPLAANTMSVIETNSSFEMPIEMSFGLHMSQRTVGQDVCVEVTSTETPDAIPADLAIATIQQATTTLTVTTVNPHGLVPGKRIGIYGVTNDSRLNYSNLVVASIPTPYQFTVTGGAGGLPSVTTGPFNNVGYVYYRSSMYEAQNGTSMVLENATATNASIYVKSEGGDALPTGTLTGNHSQTISSTASATAISALGTYAFQPSTEYRINLQADRIQYYDGAVDTTASPTHRLLRTQVVPNPALQYKLKFRASNNKSLTIPVAQIVSISKSGSTTWTVNTAVAHGLTTGDYINIYGVRDITNFPNITTQTVVASTPSSTQFTVVSTTGTATSYGGFVSRVQGGITQQGALAQNIQSAAVDATTLTLVGNTTWAGVVIGDYVNVLGCRNIVDGSTMGVDGVYRIRNVTGTTMVLEPIGSTVLPAAFGTTNCGGGIIKRTDVRISFVRIFDFTRERVELLSRPSGDTSSAIGVQIQATPSVTQAGTWAINGTLGSNPTNTLVYDSQHNLWTNSIRKAVL